MATATKAQTQTLEEKRARLAELQAEAQQLPDLIPAAARSGTREGQPEAKTRGQE